jgi:hypothetical protein
MVNNLKTCRCASTLGWVEIRLGIILTLSLSIKRIRIRRKTALPLSSSTLAAISPSVRGTVIQSFPVAFFV